jgi:menaquinone-specific isochorismate synthase
MTVSTCGTDFDVEYKQVQQFVSVCHEKCQTKNCSQILSISLEIEFLDPLIIFQEFAQANQLSLYFEHRVKKEAIAAIDAVAKLEIAGKQRFAEVEDFIKKSLINTSCFGNTQQLSGPHFFCSFSFFDEITQADYPFAAATVFLPKLQVSRLGDRCTLVFNKIIHSSTNQTETGQELAQTLEKVRILKKSVNRVTYLQTSPSNLNNADDFQRSIVAALKSINNHRLHKIVLANVLDISANHPFDLYNSLNNLRQLYPSCYVFSLSNGSQNFIGASPERLISIRNHQLVVDALAGSAPRGKTPAEDAQQANRLLHNDKERHEHQLVIDFITQSLSALGLQSHLLPPRLRQLANIQHLWTPISAEVPPDIHPLKIVAQLHPTPAVAGVNRDIACKEIRRYENFERGLYAAPLGWVDFQGNSEFIVGIRSALIDGSRARLYAGAGIVAGSKPEKELAEIQLKLQALLKALS